MGLLQKTAAPSLSTNQKAWLKSPRRLADEKSGVFLSGNGTTNFNVISGGTVLGKITSSSKLRPCGATLAGANAAQTNLLVDDSANFRVGDTIKVISTLGVQGTAELTDMTAAGDDIELFEVANQGLAHVVTLDASAVRDSTEVIDITWAGTPGESVATIDIGLRATAGPTIAATCDEVIAAINTTGILYAEIKSGGTPTNVCDDATVTATLAGGIAVGGNIDASEVITAIPDATHITTATSMTTVAGDKVLLTDGSDTPVGILESSLDTYSHRTNAGVETHADKACVYLLGNVRADSSQLTGYDATLMASTFSSLGIRVE